MKYERQTNKTSLNPSIEALSYRGIKERSQTHRIVRNGEMAGPTRFGFGGKTDKSRNVVPEESEDDALMAKALNALSMEEREKVYEEVGLV
jgi:hypothetical protein